MPQWRIEQVTAMTLSVVLNFSPCYAIFLQFKLKITYFASLWCVLVTVFQGREQNEQSAVRFVGESMTGAQKLAGNYSNGRTAWHCPREITRGDWHQEGGKGAQTKRECVITPNDRNILVATEINAHFEKNLSSKFEIKCSVIPNEWRSLFLYEFIFSAHSSLCCDQGQYNYSSRGKTTPLFLT